MSAPAFTPGPRFYVAETPKGLWPYAVMDRERGTWVARCNDRRDAEEEAAQRNAVSA